MSEAFGEPILLCVQCGSQFQASKNVEGSCLFHSAAHSGRGNPPCCGQPTPCSSRRHRTEHHNEYVYPAFIERAQNVLNYSDTKETWLSLEEKDLDGGDTQRAAAYKLLRWQSRGSALDAPLLLVRVGTIWHTSKSYFFDTFSEDQLEKLQPDAGAARTKLIHRAGDDDQEFAQAEWVFDADGHLSAIRLTCKARNNAEPTVDELSLIAKPLAKGAVVHVQSGAFKEYAPSDPELYATGLAPVRSVGCSMDDWPAVSRAARTFKTQGALASKLRVKPNAKGVASAGSARNAEGRGSDSFTTSLSFLGTDPSTPLVLMEISVDWRLVGDQEWRPADELDFPNGSPGLPLTCPPLQSVDMAFKWRVKMPDEWPADTDMAGERRFDRSLLARRRPIRFRFTCEALDGTTATHVLEFVQSPPKRKEKGKDDLLFLTVDNPAREDRVALSAVVGSGSTIIRVGNQGLNEDGLRQLAFRGCRADQSELPVESMCKEATKYNRHSEKVVALIDVSCQRVYALKVLLTRTDCPATAMGYVAVPLYGSTAEERPPVLATEAPMFPEDVAKAAEEAAVKDDAAPLPTDDDYDDVTPGNPAAGGGTANGSQAALAAGGVVSVDGAAIASRLASIDEKFDRICNLLERLVVASEQKK